MHGRNVSQSKGEKGINPSDSSQSRDAVKGLRAKKA